MGPWAGAGFDVDEDGRCWIGGIAVDLVGSEDGQGLLGWSVDGAPGDDLDGIATYAAVVADPVAFTHPNGVVAIDHAVVLSPDLARTKAAFSALGYDPRRERDGELGGRSIRQVFFRFGTVIVEVVGSPDTASEGPSTLWGMTYVVEDIDAAAAYFGDRASPVKDAVQPGRRITTLRHRDLGLSVRTALITPHVKG